MRLQLLLFLVGGNFKRLAVTQSSNFDFGKPFLIQIDAKTKVVSIDEYRISCSLQHSQCDRIG